MRITDSFLRVSARSGVVPTFISQALRGEPLTVLRRWPADPLALLSERSHRGPRGDDGGAGRHRPLASDDPTRRLPGITRARVRLGWEPRVSLAEGLAATIEYFKARLPVRANGKRASARTKLALFQ